MPSIEFYKNYWITFNYVKNSRFRGKPDDTALDRILMKFHTVVFGKMSIIGVISKFAKNFWIEKQILIYFIIYYII